MKVKDVRMNFLVNSNSHGIGINSARSPNMTCKCDEIACQCFHSSYHVSSVLEAKDLPGKFFPIRRDDFNWSISALLLTKTLNDTIC